MSMSPSNPPAAARISLSKRITCLTAAGVMLATSLVPVFGQAQFYGPPVSTVDMQDWLNQQIQATVLAQNTGGSQLIATSIQQSQDSMSGCGQCGSPPVVTPPCDVNPPAQNPTCGVCQPIDCDPFMGLYGKKVVVRLQENVTLSGALIVHCKGFLIMMAIPSGKTLTVNVEKILYIESD